jgi:hypothetical protein
MRILSPCRPPTQMKSSDDFLWRRARIEPGINPRSTSGLLPKASTTVSRSSEVTIRTSVSGAVAGLLLEKTAGRPGGTLSTSLHAFRRVPDAGASYLTSGVRGPRAHLHSLRASKTFAPYRSLGTWRISHSYPLKVSIAGSGSRNSPKPLTVAMATTAPPRSGSDSIVAGGQNPRACCSPCGGGVAHAKRRFHHPHRIDVFRCAAAGNEHLRCDQSGLPRKAGFDPFNACF